MALQFSIAARNARLDTIEATAGAGAKLQIRTLSPPADCAAGDVGSLLCEITLPGDWMNDAAGGTKTMKGAWSGSATGAGTAAHFRLKDSAGTTCHLQGTVALAAADMTIDNTSIGIGQTVNVIAFTLTDANA